MGLFRLFRMVGTALTLFAVGRRLFGQVKEMKARKEANQGTPSDYSARP